MAANAIPASANPVSNDSSTASVEVEPDVLSAIKTGGDANVIVSLKDHSVSELGNSTNRADLASDQNEVIDNANLNDRETESYSRIPAISTTVDKNQLEKLKSDPNVDSVRLVKFYKTSDMPETIPADSINAVTSSLTGRPELTQSVSLLDADDAWNNVPSYTGTSQKVVVIDTGVDKTHPFLSGAVTAEACFAQGPNGAGVAGSCPNGFDSQTVSGAGVPCSTVSTCSHGTHVAGIIAGRQNVAGGPTGGIAPDANIVAIQVFSTYTSSDFVQGTSTTVCSSAGTTSPCILTSDPDIYDALNWVLSNSTGVAAVNMSLGGGSYSQYCDADSPEVAGVITSLRTAGILTVVASGNDGDSGGVSWPACISTAVAVGATNKSSVVQSYSNSNAIVSLWAPGGASNVPGAIFSSVPNSPTLDTDGTVDGWGYKYGTSMAAPMIAGAIALVRQAKPGESAGVILARLQGSGVSVTDSRNGVTRKRPSIIGAINLSAPAASNPISVASAPASASLSATYGYGILSWSASSGATSYDIYNINGTFIKSVTGTSTTVPTYRNQAARFSVRATNVAGSSSGRTSNTVVGIASKSEWGYAVFAANGAVSGFGTLAGYSHGPLSLNRPVVGGTTDPLERGGWAVAGDGGIFTFGGVNFWGSTGSYKLNQPIVGMASTATGNGYWLVASDGGIFAFGDAQFFGSTGSYKLNQPIVGMKATIDGSGYWLFARDGGVFAFTDVFLGSGAPTGYSFVGGG